MTLKINLGEIWLADLNPRIVSEPCDNTNRNNKFKNSMKKQIKSIIFIILLCFNCLSIKADSLKREDFYKLPGYIVKFDYEGHPEEREIAYKYFIKYYEGMKPPIDKENIGIDLYDIDNDGKKEILVYLTSNGYCGSRGCNFEIFKLKEKSNEYLISILSLTVRKDIKILKHTILGYHDILFNAQADTYRIWRWNGKEYDLYK